MCSTKTPKIETPAAPAAPAPTVEQTQTGVVPQPTQKKNTGKKALLIPSSTSSTGLNI